MCKCYYVICQLIDWHYNAFHHAIVCSNLELKYQKVPCCWVLLAVEKLCLPKLLQLRHLCHFSPWLDRTLWRCLVVCIGVERTIVWSAFQTCFKRTPDVNCQKTWRIVKICNAFLCILIFVWHTYNFDIITCIIVVISWLGALFWEILQYMCMYCLYT